MEDMLLMDVKRTFDHVSKNELMRKIEAMGVDGDLVRCTGSFMSERRVSLVVQDHQCDAPEVKTGAPQGFPGSPILFAAYLSRIFKEVETEMEGCMATLFADNCGWLVGVNPLPQLYERLEKARIKVVEW